MKKETFDLCINMMHKGRRCLPATKKAAELILVDRNSGGAWLLIKQLEMKTESGYYRRNLKAFCKRIWLKHIQLYQNGLIDEPPSPHSPELEEPIKPKGGAK